ncbi:hypothetical protein U1Q18_016932 [Sarracenia purpurea var. burkii]
MQAAQERRAGSGALSCGDCGSLGSGGEHTPGASGIGRKKVPRGLSATKTSPTSYSVHQKKGIGDYDFGIQGFDDSVPTVSVPGGAELDREASGCTSRRTDSRVFRMDDG